MNVFVVVPNWNGAEDIVDCLKSLKSQTQKHTLIVVDNGSVDDSVTIIKNQFPEAILIALPKNTGFAGGVNTGINHALQNKADAVALFNNDAIADKDWLKELVSVLSNNKNTGIVTGKLMQADKKHIDSTGDIYTTWGLAYPGGRDQPDTDTYNKESEVFGASGGASLYRAELFKNIGLFDEHFFAYLEDVDISFRAQLAGWKVMYNPKALAYHKIGATSGKIKGFSTYHYMKNLPALFWKNVPFRFIPYILPRVVLAYWSIVISSTIKGKGYYVFKGIGAHILHVPVTFKQRWYIQKNKKVSDDYIWSILTHDLPPNANNLRRLRSIFTRKN